MMTIKMLRNDRGAEDGVSVKYYEKDQTYDVSTGLGSTLVKSGSAERVNGDEVEADPVPESVEVAQTKAEKRKADKAAEEDAAPAEEKAVNGAPKNKAVNGAPDNKTAA